MTSSTRPGSIPVRSARACSTWADRSTGWMPRSAPFRLPTGVRTAPTITASLVTVIVYHNPYQRYARRLSALSGMPADRMRSTHVGKDQDRRHRDHRLERWDVATARNVLSGPKRWYSSRGARRGRDRAYPRGVLSDPRPEPDDPGRCRHRPGDRRVPRGD